MSRTSFVFNIGLDEFEALGTRSFQCCHVARSWCLIAFAAHGLNDPSAFLDGVRKAVDAAFLESIALQALTSNPASWMGVEDPVGSLEQGSTANVLVTDGPLGLEASTHLVEH